VSRPVARNKRFQQAIPDKVVSTAFWSYQSRVATVELSDARDVDPKIVGAWPFPLGRQDGVPR